MSTASAMVDNLDIAAMIPARMGSTRLRMKNLALVNGQPLISYAIRAAQQANVFRSIVVNSDHPLFAEIASRYGVGFYRRPPELGSSTTTSDAVVADYLRQHACDILVWVNPISPLQPPDEICSVVHYFVENELDTLITVQDHHVHCIYDGEPVNFSAAGEFSRTQDLRPIRSFVYSLMMWRSETFVTSMNERDHGILSGRIGYYPVSKLSSFIVKDDEDLRVADALARAQADGKMQRVKYDPIV